MAIGMALAPAMGMISDAISAGRTGKQQQDYQNRQFDLQTKLNEQNLKQNKEMWDYTNYPNQVAKMREAGLNTALMYGGGGGGGSTPSSAGGGGGSIPMANAPVVNQGANTGMALMPTMEKLGSEINLNNALADKARADATKTGGADTENVGADTENKKANTILTNLRSDNQKLLNNITEKTTDDVVNTVTANYKKAEGEAQTALANGSYSEATAKQNLKNMQLDGMLTSIQAEAQKAGIQLTQEQTRAISENLAQGWEELYQKDRANDIAKGNQNINGFKAKADYAIDKANVDLRAKEVMIRGAEAFINGISKNKERSSTTNTESFDDGEGGRTSTTHTKYK